MVRVDAMDIWWLIYLPYWFEGGLLLKFLEILFICELKYIILSKVRFNQREVRLNIRKFRKQEY